MTVMPIKIETERLVLRNFNAGDLDGFVRLIRDKMSAPDAIYDDRFPTDRRTLALILDSFAAGDEFLAVCKGYPGELIGFIALLRAEEPDVRRLGFCIRSDMRGLGYAREAAGAAIRFAAESLGVSRLTAGAAAANTASLRLLRSLGFIRTGERDAVFSEDAAGNPVTLPGVFFEMNI